MWEWFIDNGIWILIISAIVVVLLLFFNEKVRSLIYRIEPDSWHQKYTRHITAIYWTIEGICVAILIMAFIAVALVQQGTRTLEVPQIMEEWFIAHGPRIILILIVGVIIWIVAKQTIPPLVRRFMTRPQAGESREGLTRRANTLRGVFLGLARVLIVLMVVLLILSEAGIAIGPILAGFGIAGIAVGFGAQYLIRDLIAGVFVLMENQYRVGDVAKVADVTGLVEQVNLRKTVLRDLDGIVHHVPNGEIKIASNYSRHFSRVNLNIPVSYGTDLDYAISVINRVCAEMAEEEAWKPVFVSVPQVLRVDKWADSSVDIKVLGDVKPLEQWRVMGELRLRLKRVFDAEGIEIPWPHTKVYFGNKPGDE